MLIESNTANTPTKKLYLESYGCQMNFADSEVVASILVKDGYETTRNVDEADVVFINTCSIRENAEAKVRKRLTEFKSKKVAKNALHCSYALLKKQQYCYL